MKYEVKTEKFEGPLELLLGLIEKRKLFINDISLSKVADDYIEYVRNHEKMPMGDTAHFILIASTLLLIKSKSLLPNLTLTEDEENDIKDLELRLKIYKRIKDAGEEVKKIFGKNPLFEPAKSREKDVVFSPHKSMTLPAIGEAIKSMLAKLPKKKMLPEAVVKKVISLEEMITTLTERVSASLRMSFKEFAGAHKGEKVNIIVGFLAMLELVKQGAINVRQESNFDDIHMETHEIGVPRYN